MRFVWFEGPRGIREHVKQFSEWRRSWCYLSPALKRCRMDALRRACGKFEECPGFERPPFPCLSSAVADKELVGELRVHCCSGVGSCVIGARRWQARRDLKKRWAMSSSLQAGPAKQEALVGFGPYSIQYLGLCCAMENRHDVPSRIKTDTCRFTGWGRLLDFCFCEFKWLKTNGTRMCCRNESMFVRKTENILKGFAASLFPCGFALCMQ